MKQKFQANNGFLFSNDINACQLNFKFDFTKIKIHYITTVILINPKIKRVKMNA